MDRVPVSSAVVPRPSVVERVTLTFRQASDPVLRDLCAANLEGTIVLSGIVPTAGLRRLAQRMAATVEGVRQLQSRIVVAGEEAAISDRCEQVLQ